ncbi:MAG TPA: HAD hydrolase family protein, partial [Chthoniobacteraceae bacterium]|nr:HAD hydrolase family protein [Chthoniobacteraceae bacterium]
MEQHATPSPAPAPARSPANVRALAADFDGTLAHEGVVEKQTLEALRRFRKSGRRLFLVTGRQFDELKI